MKHISAVILQFFFLTCIFAQNTQHIVTTDIDNFWTDYDKLVTTKDNAEQLDYLNRFFIGKGTPGLAGIMKARNSSPQDYLDAINKYPLFWKSIRANTFKAKGFAAKIEIGIGRLKKIYPELKPANIYFTIGVLRTGGTTIDHNVLIGSEIALADKNTDVSEFPEQFSNLKTYFASNPINDVVLNNVHEFIHTQQKTTVCDNLLAQSVMEGVAEFLSSKALNVPSSAPAIAYGQSHATRIKKVFTAQMFNSSYGYWLYSNAKNEFDTRDLGYYVGYAVAEQYYKKARDKRLAVKEMIELDYNDPRLLAKYVDQSGYFPKSMKEYEREFEQNRPQVVGFEPFKNGDIKVSPSVMQLTVKFSKPMNTYYRNFQLGPLGENALLKIKKVIGFSEDGKSFSFEIEPLQPNKHYQLSVDDGFRDEAGVSLKPYLIDFTTAEK